MNIPDGMIYASTSTFGLLAGWCIRQAVKEYSAKPDSMPSSLPLVAPPPPPRGDPDSALLGLSVRELKVVTDVFEKQFNGRYLGAEEGRRLFKELMDRIDTKTEELRRDMAHQYEQLHARISRVRDEGR